MVGFELGSLYGVEFMLYPLFIIQGKHVKTMLDKCHAFQLDNNQSW